MRRIDAGRSKIRNESHAERHRVGYRPAIDGLRAIAVLSVILGHAGFSLLPAGFLGVDIFFVISGYLITNILYADLENGRFSITQFYLRRVRRLMPALMLILFLTTVTAYLVMIPDDLEDYGESLVATVLFSNNILLYLTAGYFETSTAFKPLMHTWSLGVEEHYYIGVPMLMALLYWIDKRRAIWIGTAVATIASFLICLWAVTAEPTANFYLLPSRAWELGAGGLIAIAEPALRRLKWFRHEMVARILPSIGLAMIVVPMVCLAHTTPLPSWPTALPVIGTCLILLLASRGDVVGKLLSSPPFVGIGLISYSAYLFHQPIFAFVRITSLEEPSPALLMALIPVVLVCAYLSWRFVENPFRNRTVPTPAMLATVGTLGIAGLAAGLVFYLSSGFYNRWPELAQGDTDFGVGRNIAYNMGPSRYEGVTLRKPTDKVNILVLGDSFGRDFINMGLKVGGFGDRNISYSRLGDCPAAMLPAAVVENVRHADFVVLSSMFDQERLRCIVTRVAALRRITRARVVVIGVKSFGWSNNAIMMLKARERYVYRPKPLAQYAQVNAEAKSLLPADTYVDIIGLLSDDAGRVPAFTPDHKFISQDRFHLSEAGASYVGNLVFRHPALRELRK